MRTGFIRTSVIVILLLAVFSFPMNSFAQASVDLIVHFVEGKPSERKIAYDVSAYLSVVDSAGNPIKDLNASDFSLTEDSQRVDIISADLVIDEPINIMLLLDTSGSMGGTGIAAVKEAASNFVAGLSAGDRIAIMTFDDEITTLIDYTTDYQGARDQIALIDAKRGAGTCLYDAAYQAVQTSASLPAGRRAVILLTDGVDEKTNHTPCSAHTIDDVIQLTSTGGTLTPIYTLGMGQRIDEKGLERLAVMAGGRYLYSPDASRLDAMFLRLADHLRSQYLLQYESVAGPGAHSLAVTVTNLGATDTDTRNFLLPAMPTRISITSLEDGQEVSGVESIDVSVTSVGELVESVAFQIDGETVGTDTTTPYAQEIDFSSYEDGSVDITVIVYGMSNAELARQQLHVNIRRDSAPQATPAKKTSLAPDNSFNWLLWGSAFSIVIFVVGIVMFRVFKRRREEKARDEAWKRSQSTGMFAAGMDERTIDDWEPSINALGMLTVEKSDDPTLIGQRFEITKPVTMLGRSADNDILFPKDSPVSRRHAQIEERDGGLFLSEVESTGKDGNVKRPTFGTYLNGKQLEFEPTLLASDDRIRLGKRVELRFEAVGKAADGEALTYDGFIADNDDTEKTQDMGF